MGYVRQNPITAEQDVLLMRVREKLATHCDIRDVMDTGTPLRYVFTDKAGRLWDVWLPEPANGNLTWKCRADDRQGSSLELLVDQLRGCSAKLPAQQVAAPKQPAGRKDDAGKTQAGILLEDFPRALLAVAQVATFGANKYERGNWLKVQDAKQRYADAMLRHMLEDGVKPCSVDAESGMLHKAHAAWNALAVLELALRELEEGAKK